MKTVKILVVALVFASGAAAFAAESAKPSGRDAKQGLTPEQVEQRAERMVKSALSLFKEDENDRAVGMLEAVSRMYPDSKAQFRAKLELGRHFLDKRTFDRAAQELRGAQKSKEEEVRAEAMLLQGQLHLAKGEGGESVMVLRRLTQDFPTSEFSNDAFFLIGQIHFDAKRWTRATEAYLMVGTAVPETGSNEVVLAEAGQRVFVHVHDKDLAVLAQIGEKSYVDITSPCGDVERVELKPFGKGDGDFLASVNTTAEDSKPNDGMLTVHGQESVKAVYVDQNTESGKINNPLDAGAHIVSSGVITFMDGAMRQSVKGVFVGQPAFLKLRDFDIDKTPEVETAKIRVKFQYRERPAPAPGEEDLPPPPPAADAPWLTRETMEMTLTETGPHTGVFTGRITPQLFPADTNAVFVLKEGEVGVHADEKIVVEYDDTTHLKGTNTIVRSAEALVLVGGSTEPQSIVAHANEATIQAKKLLLEAQLFYKWGTIFKEVGLDATANSKADEGLERIQELMDLGARFSLDRSVLEEAYEAKWNLLLVKGNLTAAIGTCRALVTRFPDTLLADRAFMQIGMARREEKTREGTASAIQVFNSIIALPTSPLKAEAQFRIGETIEEEIRANPLQNGKADYSAAMMAYKRCAEGYPSSSFAGESYKRIIDYNISTRSYQQAQETLERVFQDYPDAPWLDEMLLKWGVVMNRMGNKEGAKEKFRRLLEEYPGGKSAVQAQKFLKKLEAQSEEG